MAGQRFKQRGDTIVEVLISIAVVSLVLGGAYAATNRNLQSSRSSQEQAAASKVVESQLEELKALADKPGGLASLPASFCITRVSGTPAPISTTDPTVPCNLNMQGVAAVASDQPVYQISITMPSAHTFQLQSKWDDVSSKKQNTIEMSYRLYPQ